MISIDKSKLDWTKMDGLIPAIVQDSVSGQVLMLAYMNPEALDQSLSTGLLTFYSRSRQALWQKGESSGHLMKIIELAMDCDGDSLLVLVEPAGPACHLGSTSCYQPAPAFSLQILSELVSLIEYRSRHYQEQSYSCQLLKQGLARCAQKVGEEAVEVVIAAMEKNPEELRNETADLLFHLLILLQVSEFNFNEVLTCLRERMDERNREEQIGALV